MPKADEFDSLKKPITALSKDEQKLAGVAAQELTAGGQVINGILYAVLDDDVWCRRGKLTLDEFEAALKHLKALGGIQMKRPSRRGAPGTTAIALLPRLTLGLGDQLEISVLKVSSAAKKGPAVSVLNRRKKTP